MARGAAGLEVKRQAVVAQVAMRRPPGRVPDLPVNPRGVELRDMEEVPPEVEEEMVVVVQEGLTVRRTDRLAGSGGTTMSMQACGALASRMIGTELVSTRSLLIRRPTIRIRGG